jgi:hypothetical protein
MRLRRVAPTVWVALGAAALGLACGVGYAGYTGKDTLFSLIWGEQIAHLASADFSGQYIPTPHPLMNLVGALLTPLGDDGATAAVALLWLASFVLLGVASFRLGRALFGVPVGVFFALVLLTRSQLVQLALYASVDIPFLAFVLLAAALETERPRRGPAVFVCLALAGLLRPEAWIFTAAYALYLISGVEGKKRLEVLALAAVAPLLWLLADLVLAGDPLFSFHRTGDVAGLLQPDTSLWIALRDAPLYVRDLVGAPVFWVGVAGSLVSLRAVPERMPLPAAVVSLSLLPFLAYGLAGLTLYPRFLLPTAAMLALFCAVAVAGWTAVPHGLQLRRVWSVAAVALVALLVAFAPSDANKLASERAGASARRSMEDDLSDLVRPGGARRYLHCPVIQVPDRALVPPLMRWLDRPARSFAITPRARLDRGLQFVVSPRSRRAFVLPYGASRGIRSWQREPFPGLALLAENRSWALYGRC